MSWIRVFAVIGGALLGGCSLSFDRTEISSNPIPDAKQQKSIDLQIQKAVDAMKGAKSLGISEAGRNAAQSGTEQWTVCARVEFTARPVFYTFFVRGDQVVESRPSVLNDDCEARVYRPSPVSSGSSIY